MTGDTRATVPIPRYPSKTLMSMATEEGYNSLIEQQVEVSMACGRSEKL